MVSSDCLEEYKVELVKMSLQPDLACVTRGYDSQATHVPDRWSNMQPDGKLFPLFTFNKDKDKVAWHYCKQKSVS